MQTNFKFSVALLLVCLCLGAVLTALAQETNPPSSGQVFRVTTDLVLLDAQVTSKKTGNAFGTLKVTDFELYEDGVKQEISFFDRDSLPLSIVLLFDLTDSTRFNMDPLVRGASQALKHLKPEDEVAVMIYGSRTVLLQDFTTDRQLILDAIEEAKRRSSLGPHGMGMAYFNEAVFQASREARRADNPDNRRVIVWLTDNVPNVPVQLYRRGRIHTEREAMDELLESGAVVSSLLTRSWLSVVGMPMAKSSPWQLAFPPGNVNNYAKATGGPVMKATKENIATKLADLIDQLRSRYTLGYRPSAEHPKDRFCKIDLKLSLGVEKREGPLQVRTRRGYYRTAKDETQVSSPVPTTPK